MQSSDTREKVYKIVKRCMIAAAALLLGLVYYRIEVVGFPAKGRTPAMPSWSYADTPRFEDGGVLFKVASWPPEWNPDDGSIEETEEEWIYVPDMDSITETEDGRKLDKDFIERGGFIHFEFVKEETTVEIDGIQARKAERAWYFAE